MAETKSACPCCSYLTFGGASQWDICPVCYWEDDPVQRKDPLLEGGANAVSLEQARRNYEAFGACEARFQEDVRKPTPDEVP